MLRGIFQGVVVRWGNLIFVYIGERNWHRFNLKTLEAAALDLAQREVVALERGQEVET
jgi:hypothetical protein